MKTILLPGIPGYDPQENKKLDTLIRNIVIVPDPDNPIMLRDTGLAGLLGKETLRINETAKRNNLKSIENTQHIEIICDLELQNNVSPQKGGHWGKLYTVESADQ